MHDFRLSTPFNEKSPDDFKDQKPKLLKNFDLNLTSPPGGVRGVELSWFSSYLSKRKQSVSVNGSTSDYLEVSCGVPQGSVLGLLLFLIYVNDLPGVSKVLSFYVFADDINIFYSSRDLITL